MPSLKCISMMKVELRQTSLTNKETTMKNLKSEAELMLNEAIGGKKKPTLKKESNENLTTFSLKKLSVAQIEQALENNGYEDNGIRKVKFTKTFISNNTINFTYACEYVEMGGETGEGTVYVFVNKDGLIVGEFTGLD